MHLPDAGDPTSLGLHTWAGDTVPLLTMFYILKGHCYLCSASCVFWIHSSKSGTSFPVLSAPWCEEASWPVSLSEEEAKQVEMDTSAASALPWAGILVSAATAPGPGDRLRG